MYGIDEEALFRVFEIAIIEQAWEGISDHIVVRLELMELTKAAQEAGDDVDSFWASDKSRGEDVSAGGGSQSILSLLQGLKFIGAVQAVREHFIAKLAHMSMLNMNEFEETQSITSHGVDSMIVVGLGNWIFKKLGLGSFQPLLGPSLTIPNSVEHVCAKHGIKRVI
ncbi:Acyl transferase/acyl hydrolase/lysophospholipase [Penicillium samsonianum]|uniref:Acyl transferase/acyl hydrolase/lysophospholipase n=1 Tax=Penicillium samsonianum TaxID=1882272 RepID=UPI002549401B|nr:Acyl transferase/acyl hydrolase/lysophospholipase [Penicillium samsonianum]KAJ6124923.1 Acyl transferase/acyl hydrolase/lysophospholipase [Penicillium samsonianum]